MNSNRRSPSGTDPESRLESGISYLLITGVILSLLLEVAGMVFYYRDYGNLAIIQDRAVFIQGHDFFAFTFGVASGTFAGGAAIRLMIAGIVVLILTPFLRVVLSVFYFGWERDYKYVVITLFVLIILIISLTLH